MLQRKNNPPITDRQTWPPLGNRLYWQGKEIMVKEYEIRQHAAADHPFFPLLELGIGAITGVAGQYLIQCLPLGG